jgi:hypothetical protein
MAKSIRLKKQMKKTRNKRRGGCPCNKKNAQSSWKLWGGKKTINYDRIIPL